MIRFDEPQYIQDGRTRRILPFFHEYPILNATLLRALIGGASGIALPSLLLHMTEQDAVLRAIAPPLGAALATRYCLCTHYERLAPIIAESLTGRLEQSSRGRMLRVLIEYPILSERLMTLALRTERIFYFEVLNDLIASGEVGVVEAPDLRTGRRLYLQRYAQLLLPFIQQNKSL